MILFLVSKIKKKEMPQEFQRDFISPPSIGMFTPVM